MNPVAASPLVGFGTPPNNVQINFSILDMHGLNDDIIPYSVDSYWSYGPGPNGGLISQDGYYYEEKITYIDAWSEAIECDIEFSYSTPYDGENGLQCFQRQCIGGNTIVRCIGDHTHEYPMSYSTASAEIA